LDKTVDKKLDHVSRSELITKLIKTRFNEFKSKVERKIKLEKRPPTSEEVKAIVNLHCFGIDDKYELRLKAIGLEVLPALGHPPRDEIFMTTQVCNLRKSGDIPWSRIVKIDYIEKKVNFRFEYESKDVRGGKKVEKWWLSMDDDKVVHKAGSKETKERLFTKK
jgi:hypothetical protein